MHRDVDDSISATLQFIEKQVLAVTLRDAFLDGGKEAVPYVRCEVFAPLDLNTAVLGHSYHHPHAHIHPSMQFDQNFRGSTTADVRVEGEVISLWTPNAHNYYHVLAELAPRVVFAVHLMDVWPESRRASVRFLVHDRVCAIFLTRCFVKYCSVGFRTCGTCAPCWGSTCRCIRSLNTSPAACLCHLCSSRHSRSQVLV